jgi:cytochrome P450
VTSRTFPDGPRLNFPIVAIAQMFPRRFPFDPLAFNVSLARKYGDIAFFRLGPLRVYQVNRPDLIREVLVDQAHKFHKPRLLKRGARRMLGSGLLTSDGNLWKQQRKLIQPAFRHDRLSKYSDTMVAHSLRIVESFRDGEVVDISAVMGKLTQSVVVKALFGEDLPPEIADVGDALLTVSEAANQRLNAVLQLPSWVPTRKNLHERKALARLDVVLRLLIHTRRNSGLQHDDLLSVLLEATDDESHARMSDHQLRDELMTLFLAGQDTTANALTWTWYLLARHRGVEVKLREELARVLAGRPPAAADLPALGYVEMVLRESMRLFPPVPAFAREPVEDVVLGGYPIAKGSLITFSTYALHRDPKFFPDPERFDPERFAPGCEESRPRYSYLPFGGGPRICIGNGFAMMEARLILASIAQRCSLTLDPIVEIAPKQVVTLRPDGPVRMRVRIPGR